MCGISGYLDLENGVRTDILRRMNDSIRHRGPDDEGYTLIGPSAFRHFSGDDTAEPERFPPLSGADGRKAFLGLGHRRLSILDLSSAGHQPMEDAQRGTVVTYNGEIYNYLELKEELAARGHVFKTTCDTEVLLKAYSEWGEDCLDHFNGMWGFALWDEKEGKLFCARDRLGAKPFNFWHEGNKFVFGSELKQLCQDDGIARRFDRSYLAANMMYHYSEYNDQTLIEGMRQLRPGHKLVVRLSPDRKHIQSVSISAYWALHVDYNEQIPEQQWKEMVAEEFSRSCRWRLRSDAPLAALLSGGLDSSCLVTEVCGQLADPGRLHTFTTHFPGHASCDEWDFADMVNHACGCQGNPIMPDMSDGIERRYEKAIWHQEAYGGIACLGGMYLLEEIRKRGFKVVLNGQCGDETMLGYERYYSFYFSDLIKRGKLGAALREYRLAAQHSAYSLYDLMKMFFYFVFPPVRDTRQRIRAGSFVQKELLDQVNSEELHSLLYPRALPQLQQTELTRTQLPPIVHSDDRSFMSASLESRIPYMDYRFVELAVQIPASLKIKNGYTKNIMREIFDSRMPKAVTWRTNKMGFGAPVDDWARLFSQDYLLDMIRNAKTAPYFKPDALEKKVLNGVRDANLFDFLSVEIFARLFDVA